MSYPKHSLEHTCVRPDVEGSEVGERAVLYHRQSGTAVVLNPTGSWPWQLLTTSPTPQTLARGQRSTPIAGGVGMLQAHALAGRSAPQASAPPSLALSQTAAGRDFCRDSVRTPLPLDAATTRCSQRVLSVARAAVPAPPSPAASHAARPEPARHPPPPCGGDHSAPGPSGMGGRADPRSGDWRSGPRHPASVSRVQRLGLHSGTPTWRPTPSRPCTSAARRSGHHGQAVRQRRAQHRRR